MQPVTGTNAKIKIDFGGGFKVMGESIGKAVEQFKKFNDAVCYANMTTSFLLSGETLNALIKYHYRKTKSKQPRWVRVAIPLK